MFGPALFGALRVLKCRVPLLPAALFALVAQGTAAHEFWLDVQEYQVANGQTVFVELTNGQEFAGIDLSYFPRRVVLFDQIGPAGRSAVTPRAGDSPIEITAPQDEGLLTLLYQSNVQTVRYRGWEKFQKFVDHKAFGEIRAKHAARGLSEEAFREIYTRFAKSLVAVGPGAGQDQARGFEIELVAGANPYTDDLSGGLPVQVLYREMPRIGAQLEVFEKAPDGTVTISLLQTDETGTARVPVKPGHAYLLDNVVLREPSEANAERFDAQWETLWASLTFSVPQ